MSTTSQSQVLEKSIQKWVELDNELKKNNDKITPIGNSWSFDTENRKSLPDNIKEPKLPKIKKDKYSFLLALPLN